MNPYYLIPIALLLIGTIVYYANRPTYKPGFVVKALITEIPGAFIFSPIKTSTSMKNAQFVDEAAKDKVCILLATLKKNAAGNFPDVKLDTLRATTSDDTIATAAASYNSATGEFRLKTKYTGKKGDVLTQLFVSPDLDNSGDPDISFGLATHVTTAEAQGFDEESVTVSDLQEDDETNPAGN